MGYGIYGDRYNTLFFIAVPDGAHNKACRAPKINVYFSHLERIAVDSKSQPCGKICYADKDENSILRNVRNSLY